MKKSILAIIALVFILGTLVYASDRFNLPRDGNGFRPASLDWTGAYVHVLDDTATGEICISSPVTVCSVEIATTSVNPCVFYGIVLSSGYDVGTDYVVLRDTFVVNTTGQEKFRIFASTTGSRLSGGETIIWTPPVPVRFEYGICATQNAATYGSRILFRYLKRD